MIRMEDRRESGRALDMAPGGNTPGVIIARPVCASFRIPSPATT